jgi:peptidylprolyl isomerase
MGRSRRGNKAKARALPPTLLSIPQGAYTLTAGAAPALEGPRLADGIYAAAAGFYQGWPIAMGPGDTPETWPVHCYGTVGVGATCRPIAAGRGTLCRDRRCAAPARSQHRRGRAGDFRHGMAVQPAARQGRHGLLPQAGRAHADPAGAPGSEVPGLPTWQYLSTASASFARYVDARANRRDPFYVARPAAWTFRSDLRRSASNPEKRR